MKIEIVILNNGGYAIRASAQNGVEGVSFYHPDLQWVCELSRACSLALDEAKRIKDKLIKLEVVGVYE